MWIAGLETSSNGVNQGPKYTVPTGTGKPLGAYKVSLFRRGRTEHKLKPGTVYHVPTWQRHPRQRDICLESSGWLYYD